MSQVAYSEFVGMASLANTLGKMIATLEPEQMVEAFLLSQGVRNCIAYDFAENGVELHLKMQWIFAEFKDNPGVFDIAIWNAIDDHDVVIACCAIVDRHKREHAEHPERFL
jgi:hypothetical protein